MQSIAVNQESAQWKLDPWISLGFVLVPFLRWSAPEGVRNMWKPGELGPAWEVEEPHPESFLECSVFPVVSSWGRAIRSDCQTASLSLIKQYQWACSAWPDWFLICHTIWGLSFEHFMKLLKYFWSDPVIICSVALKLMGCKSWRCFSWSLNTTSLTKRWRRIHPWVSLQILKRFFFHETSVHSREKVVTCLWQWQSFYMQLHAIDEFIRVL